MNDYETAEKIMAAKRPAEQKNLGKQVKNWDEDRWNAAGKDVVKRGNIAKVCVTSCRRSIVTLIIDQT